ncbi:MAG: histidine triad nucleotide-binding protein [Candidatus Marinimicrobia bacterium]|nr:histidine triad nucleotide-binding protein [Candidatus Neomarinimicrobiota bacterium]
MTNCIFCKIIKGEIESDIVFENDKLIAFKDLNPQAPIHILIIPKKHISRIENLEKNDSSLMGDLVFAAKQIAEKMNVKNGYRLVFNNGPNGGQEVEHIHLHLLAGRKFTWPAG